MHELSYPYFKHSALIVHGDYNFTTFFRNLARLEAHYRMSVMQMLSEFILRVNE